MLRAAELAMEEKRGKLSTSELQQIELIIFGLKEALGEGEREVIEERTEELRKALEKV